MTDIQEAVRQRYGAIAEAVKNSSQTGSCCGPSACGCSDLITSNLYSSDETGDLPSGAVAASLGCGNPTALSDLKPGETVLDLGSGGGIDVFLSAKRVGPAGKVYGLDMTDAMLDLARANQAKAGATNVEFLTGTIESIPLPSSSVDVIISNCVINLSSDKDAGTSRGVPSPEARWPIRRFRRRRSRRRAVGSAPQHGVVGGMHWGRSSGLRVRAETPRRRIHRRERGAVEGFCGPG